MKRIGIRPGCLKLGWREAQAAAGRLGFDGVEPTVQEADVARLLTPEGQEEVRGWCESTGCVVSSLSVGCFQPVNFALPDAAARQRGVELVRDCLRAARGIGAEALLLPHFERERPDRCLYPAEVAAYVEGLKQVADATEETGVFIGLETSFSVEQLQEIARGVGAPRIGVYHDLSNALYYGHDTIEMLTGLARETAMIHVKDGNHPLGDGPVDWDAVRRVLPTLPYNTTPGVGAGWYVLETPGLDDPVANAARNLAFTRELVRDC